MAIPTLDGDVDVELEPGTQPGHVHVLRGRGCPCSRETAAATTGCSSNVLVPRRLSAEQQELLEGYAAAEDDAAYADDEGFVERLKARFR